MTSYRCRACFAPYDTQEGAEACWRSHTDDPDYAFVIYRDRRVRR